MNKLTQTIAALSLAAAAMAFGPVAAQTPTTSGEVVRLDKAAGRLTIKHGEIPNLQMPPMTMVFRFSSPTLIEGVAVGDRIRFAAERIDGNFTVVALSKAP